MKTTHLQKVSIKRLLEKRDERVRLEEITCMNRWKVLDVWSQQLTPFFSPKSELIEGKAHESEMEIKIRFLTETPMGGHSLDVRKYRGP